MSWIEEELYEAALGWVELSSEQSAAKLPGRGARKRGHVRMAAPPTSPQEDEQIVLAVFGLQDFSIV